MDRSLRIARALQYAAALLLLALATARLLWPEATAAMDGMFGALIAGAIVLALAPLDRLRTIKAGGLEVILDSPQVRGAIDGLDLQYAGSAIRDHLLSLGGLVHLVRDARILWIDDRPESVTGERRLLRSLGAAIVPATSSEDAYKLLRSDGDFDLIVSDVQRSGDYYKAYGGVDIHDGVNFVRWLRDQPETVDGKRSLAPGRETPVVFYAAYDWPRLVRFTAPVAETEPPVALANSVRDLISKVVLQLKSARDSAPPVHGAKTPTRI